MKLINFNFPPQNSPVIEKNKTTKIDNNDNNTTITNSVKNNIKINNNVTRPDNDINNINNINNNNRILVKNTNPTIYENLPIGTIWINKITGETFICVNDTYNANRWVGSFGTLIEPNSFYLVDFFKDNSIIAFYRFDGSTDDDTGLFNGFKLGDVTYTKGLFDKAINFGEVPNKTNAFVVKNIALYPEMNFSFWVYKYDNNIINPYISLAYANIYNGILLYEDNDIFNIILNNQIYTFDNSQYIPTKQWIFMSINIFREPKKVELYINGEFVDDIYYTIDFAPEKYSLNNCLVFAQDQDTLCGGFQTTQSFMGKLDQFRIFKRTLTPDEIKQLYNEQP